MTTITPIVLCGGAGSRLWPLSREEKPKQFHSLDGNKSILTETLDRLRKRSTSKVDFAPVIMVGAAGLKDHILDDAHDSDHPLGELICEPFRRDSAPAIAAALIGLNDADPDQIVAVLPSDHGIRDVEALHDDLEAAAVTAADKGWIMTIGIRPDRPETQFGYVEYERTGERASPVRRFREKPDQDTAREYLQNGHFYWNAGMFVFRVRDMVDAFARHAPEMLEAATNAVREGHRNGSRNTVLNLNPERFGESPSQSLDYAIMEPLANEGLETGRATIGIIGSSFDWNDLGSWGQLYDATLQPYGADRNVLLGDIVSHDVERSYLRNDSGRLLTAAGLSDIVVVAEPDVVMVTHRHKTHLIKNLHSKLKRRERPELIARARDAGPPDVSPAQARQWLMDQAILLWRDHGCDVAHGGVHEHLHYDGTPVEEPVKRVRVLPRQIYSFAKARLMGFEGISDAILRTLTDCLTETAWHRDGGWVHLFNADGSVHDDTRDFYDQCFVLLAFATLYRATGWSFIEQWIARSLDYLDQTLADPHHGGFFENEKKSGPRRANPHMHYLEAMLALHEMAGDTSYLDRAQVSVDLFRTCFFNPQTNTLTEHFEADWTPKLEGKDGLVEPGHHYEWVWLLLRYDALRPTPGLVDQALALFTHANSFGHNAKTGLVRDVICADGRRPDPEWSSKSLETSRCWPQTEALKAGLSLKRRGIEAGEVLATNALNALFRQYLIGADGTVRPGGGARCVPGGWVDCRDADGKPVSPYMPASTLYHIVCAIAELDVSDVAGI